MSSDFVCWSFGTRHTRTYWTNTQLQAWRAVKGYIYISWPSTLLPPICKPQELLQEPGLQKLEPTLTCFYAQGTCQAADCHQARFIKALQHNTASCNISVSLKGQPNALAVSCWCLCFVERSTRDLPARDVQSWHYPRSNEQKSWNLVIICGRGGDTCQRPSILSRETLLPCLAWTYYLHAQFMNASQTNRQKSQDTLWCLWLLSTLSCGDLHARTRRNWGHSGVVEFCSASYEHHASPPAAPDPRLTKSLILTCAPQGLRAGRQATLGLWVLKWVGKFHTLANASFKKVLAAETMLLLSFQVLWPRMKQWAGWPLSAYNL